MSLQRRIRGALGAGMCLAALSASAQDAPAAVSPEAAPPPPLVLRQSHELSSPTVIIHRSSPDSAIAPRVIVKEEPTRGAVFLRADNTDGTRDAVEASGHVELRSHRETVLSDWMRYDQSTDTVYARGNVLVRRYGSWMTGPELDYTRPTATGTLESPQFHVDEIDGRGDAETLTFVGPDRYDLNNGRFTTCQAPRDDWFLYAKTMEIDTQRSVGTAYNASIRFMNVPILYSPWLEFPLNGDRKSGFLTPTYGTSNARGVELTTPYYFNLAPNYDATLAPRVMSKRGLQLGGQFRYMFGGELPMQGEINGEALDDHVTNSDRYMIAWKHQQGLTSWMNAYVDLNKVSDDKYFADLADRIAVTSQTTLPREAGIRLWQGPFSALARVQSFQTLQDDNAPITPPYNRTPQVLVNMAEWAPEKLRGLGFGISGVSDYSHFSQSSQTLEGQRFVVQPTASWHEQTLGWFSTARASLQQRNYWLDNNAGLINSGLQNTPDMSATIPVFSLDGGLVFEREGSMFGNGYVQTLEPRAFYVYVPYRNQNSMPVFDTTLDDFNFAQLFSENRYIGYDRFGDANQLTTALTSRILSEAGAERLRIMVGERFYFSNQLVTLPGEAPRSAASSDFLFGVEGYFSRTFSASVLTQYNFDQGQTERFNAGLRWSPEPGKVLSGSWRYNRQFQDETGITELKQVDLAGQWPLSMRWSVVGRWNYSFEDSKTLEAIGGVEYNADCWVIRAAIHRLATTVDQTNTSFFLQLELSGLGRIGSSPLEVLRRSAPNYTTSNDPSRRDASPTYMTYPEF